MSIEFENCLLDDEILPVSLLKLFEIFKENLIRIYAGIIQEKRIIIFSQEKPCWYICTMTCAVARLVSPPIPYVLKRHVYPFVHLNNLDFVNTNFFIAGANNPLFKHRSQWWDIFANLDTGEVFPNASMPKLYQDFIENFSKILPREPRKELWIRSQFYDFTQHLIDSCLHTDLYDHFNCKIPSEDLSQSLLIQYWNIKDFENIGNTPAKELRNNLLKLRLSHIRENTSEIHEIYKTIYKHLETDSNCYKLLEIMPNSGDLHCLAWGFFTENTKAWKYVCKILQRLEKIPEGKFLVMDLSTSELNAYLAYRYRL